MSHKITSILMVCLGNICRSPLAEGIMAAKVDLSKISVDSAGTADYHVGALPDPRSIEIAKKYGIDITHQRGRQFVQEDFDRFDEIYVMDQSNYLNVLKLARDQNDKQKVDFILNQISPGVNDEVPDPYYGGESGFDHVYRLLDEATTKIAERLENQYH